VIRGKARYVYTSLLVVYITTFELALRGVKQRLNMGMKYSPR